MAHESPVPDGSAQSQADASWPGPDQAYSSAGQAGYGQAGPAPHGPSGPAAYGHSGTAAYGPASGSTPYGPAASTAYGPGDSAGYGPAGYSQGGPAEATVDLLFDRLAGIATPDGRVDRPSERENAVS